jgi:methyl-accepting chemotaxis protein
MDNNNNQKEIAGMVERALDDFRQGMEYREQLSIRIGRRTTQIIRFGMIALSIGTIIQVERTLTRLNEHITVMPALNDSVGSMDSNLGLLRTDLHSMVEQIEYMNGNVLNMANSMQVLNNQFNDMNRTVGNMASNMRQMAKPMKVLPF